MEWFHTAIPKTQEAEIRRIMPALGYSSVQAFITEAVRIHLGRMIRRYDEIEHEREVGRKVLGKDDSDVDLHNF